MHSKRTNLKKAEVNSAVFANYLITYVLRHLTALCITLPYMFWRMVWPKKNRKGNYLSSLMRPILEFRKTRQVVGVNLASVLILFTTASVPTIASTMNDTSDTVEPIKPLEMVITTEDTYRAPVPGYISQYFSWHHPGIDIAGNDSSLIYPITNGKVVQIERSFFGYGLNVMVDHGDGIVSRYAHMRKVLVELNQSVDKNTALGYVGSTGWSTGPHLHLEVYQNGRAINPLAAIPNVYSDKYIAIKPPQSMDTSIAAPTTNVALGGANPAATFSAEVTFKEVADGFQEPNAYGFIASYSGELSK